MSKGLEALNSLFETMPFAFLESNTMKELKIIEKELKALAIIKKLDNIKTFINYNLDYLTPQEYNLLKEVLNA